MAASSSTRPGRGCPRGSGGWRSFDAGAQRCPLLRIQQRTCHSIDDSWNVGSVVMRIVRVPVAIVIRVAVEQVAEQPDTAEIHGALLLR
jgi:hypothetical protein